MTALRRDGPDLLLELYLQPRGGLDAVTGLHGDAFRVRIGAPPVDGAANAQLRRFLADSFLVPLRRVVIESGERARRKRVRIQSPRREPGWLDLAGTRR